MGRAALRRGRAGRPQTWAMSYQVIARKYRPQRFSEVVGQEHVTRTLANAIAQNRIAHAYLFCGPRGTGKTTIARIFAKCLNATNGPTVDFSDDDPRCREITEGRSLDVLEIDAASNRGIDEIRGLRETVQYAPAHSRFKIYIIDEVHMLTKEAFNALLKTLEEPPEHVKFMFATTEPEKVPATILSRCQRFDLRRIPTALIVRHLAHIARAEGVDIEEAALFAIARGADGGLRDAESTLDQLISFCGSRIQEADVLAMFGLTARDQLLGLTAAMVAGRRGEVVRRLDQLLTQGKDPGRLLADLLLHFRNLMVWHLTGGDPELLDVSEAERTALQEQAAQITWEGAHQMVEVLADAETRLREAASKQILLEVALLRAMEARQAMSLERVLEQLRDLRATATESVTSVGAPPVERAVATAAGGGSENPAPRGAPSAAGLSRPEQARAEPPPALGAGPAGTGGAVVEEVKAAETDLNGFWARLQEAVGKVSPFLRTYLDHARPLRWEQQTLVIGFPPEWREYRDLADTPRFHELLQTKLQELRAPGAHVKFVVSEPGSGDISPRPEPGGVFPEEAQPPAAAVVQPESVEGPGARAPRGKTARSRSAASGAPVAQEGLRMEDFKNDPLIQKALEMFKARLVQMGR